MSELDELRRKRMAELQQQAGINNKLCNNKCNNNKCNKKWKRKEANFNADFNSRSSKSVDQS